MQYTVINLAELKFGFEFWAQKQLTIQAALSNLCVFFEQNVFCFFLSVSGYECVLEGFVDCILVLIRADLHVQDLLPNHNV